MGVVFSHTNPGTPSESVGVWIRREELQKQGREKII